VIPSINQTRGEWFHRGDALEQDFLAQFGKVLGLKSNPDRAISQTAIDLVRMADLKTITTPFRIYPDCVPFNAKDMLYYRQCYTNPEIYFWVKWDAPKRGVWKVTLVDLIIQRARFDLHWYLERGRQVETDPDTREALQRMEPERLKAPDGGYFSVRDERGNAMCSYIVPLDLPLVQVA
jgi:hypothetical protein